MGSLRSPGRIALLLLAAAAACWAIIAAIWGDDGPLWAWFVTWVLAFVGLLVGLVAVVVALTERLMGGGDD